VIKKRACCNIQRMITFQFKNTRIFEIMKTKKWRGERIHILWVEDGPYKEDHLLPFPST
jgi:hypothetical protein